MNKLILDPISKLLQIEKSGNSTRKLNNLESKKEFLHDFKSFLKNSDEGSLLIDRFRLKKIKNDLKTKHQPIFEENKSAYIVNDNHHLNRNMEYLSINNAYKLNSENNTNGNNQGISNSKSSLISATPQNDFFVICSKNSKNIKNLKLFEEIKETGTKNEFYEAFNIINTNSYLNTLTKANTTKSIGVETNSDFNYVNNNNKNNIYINNSNDLSNKAEIDISNAKVKEDKMLLKKTVQEIIEKDQIRQVKDTRNIKNSYVKNPLKKFNAKEEIKKEEDGYNCYFNKNNNRKSINKKSRKKLNRDIENILTNESIVLSIRHEKEKSKTGHSSTRRLQKEKNEFNDKINAINNENNKLLADKVIVREKIKSPPIKYLQRLQASPKVCYRKKTEENPDNKANPSSNAQNVFTIANNETKNFPKEKANQIKSSNQIALIITENDAKATYIELNKKDKIEFESNKSCFVARKLIIRNKREKGNHESKLNANDLTIDGNSNHENVNLQMHTEINQLQNKVLDFNEVLLPNITREKHMNYRRNELKRGNIKNLSETFINNFKVKSKARVKKNNHKLFFLNLDEKQF